MSESSDDIFTNEYEVHLDRQYGNPDGDWPKCMSEILASLHGNGELNGIYIHRSLLPSPLPERMKVRFERV